MKGMFVRDVRSLLALLLAALTGIASCSTTGTPPKTTAGTVDQQVLAAALEGFRSSDGQLYSMETRDINTEVPSLRDSAFALTALRRAGALPRSLTLSAPDSKIFRQEIDTEPLRNRGLLHLLSTVLTEDPFRTTDLDAVRSAYQRGGFFADPGDPPEMQRSQVIRLSLTAAMVELLRARDPRFLRDRMTEIQGYLKSIAAYIETSPVFMLYRWRIERAVDMPITSVRSNLDDWWVNKGASFPIPATGDDLFEISSFIILSDATKVDLSGRRQQLERIISPESHRPDGVMQITDAMFQAWLDIGGSAERLRPVIDYINGLRQDGGMVVPSIYYKGTIDASYAVTRLRREAGLDTRDPELVAGLLAHEPTISGDLQGDSYFLAAQWLAVLKMAGGRASAKIEKFVRDNPDKILPPRLNPQTVRSWMLGIEILHELDLPVPERDIPSPDSWPIASADDLVGLFRLIHGLRAMGRPIPAGPWRDKMGTYLDAALSQGTMEAVAGAAESLRLTNGSLSADQRRRVLAYLDEVQGCRASKLLYRISSDQPRCIAMSTLQAFRLQALLDHRPR
jgi:hypothetical protein